MKLQLAIAELEETRQWLDVIDGATEEIRVSSGCRTRAADIDDTLRTVRGHA